MFVVDYCFTFEGEIPTPEQIVNQIRKNTDIPLHFSDKTISSPITQGELFMEYVTIKDDFDYDGINIVAYNVKMTYLAANTLCSIFQLGGVCVEGEYDFRNEIPDWSKLPFEEARQHPDFIT